MLPEIRVSSLFTFVHGETIYFANFYSLLLLLGVFCGAVVAARRARAAEISVQYTLGAAVILVVVGLIGSQLLYLAYFPGRLAEAGLWQTISSFHNPKSSLGGMLGGMIAFFAVTAVARPPRGRLAFIDVIVPGAIVGFIFGRLACTLIHDHVGVETSLITGVQYADAVRHNLGMYEFLFLLFFLYPLSLWLHARKVPPGVLTGLCVWSYGIVRFFLDTLRTDTRYSSLTPAQYGCIILVLVALSVLVYAARQERPLITNSETHTRV